MTDLGDLIGSMMTGFLKARKMADEQTAALAEYYKENPLLEGLSIPRVRIPEITIDFPILIENHAEGESGAMEEPEKIQNVIMTQLKETFTANNLKLTPALERMFAVNVGKQLLSVKESNTPIVKETISRGVQIAFTDALKRTSTVFTPEQEKIISRDLRNAAIKSGISKSPISSGVIGNIRTADVKEKSTPGSVTRIKITLKEEGLEWSTQAAENGGINRTLQPE